MGQGQVDVLHADAHLAGPETIKSECWKLRMVKLERGMVDEVRAPRRRTRHAITCRSFPESPTLKRRLLSFAAADDEQFYVFFP